MPQTWYAYGQLHQICTPTITMSFTVSKNKINSGSSVLYMQQHQRTHTNKFDKISCQHFCMPPWYQPCDKQLRMTGVSLPVSWRSMLDRSHSISLEPRGLCPCRLECQRHLNQHNKHLSYDMPTTSFHYNTVIQCTMLRYAVHNVTICPLHHSTLTQWSSAQCYWYKWYAIVNFGVFVRSFLQKRKIIFGQKRKCPKTSKIHFRHRKQKEIRSNFYSYSVS